MSVLCVGECGLYGWSVYLHYAGNRAHMWMQVIGVCGREIKEGFLAESMLKFQGKGQLELGRWTGKKGGENAPTKRTRIPPMTRDRCIHYHD